MGGGGAAATGGVDSGLSPNDEGFTQAGQQKWREEQQGEREHAWMVT